MINPNSRSSRESKSITTPDELRIKIDHDILSNNVGNADHSQSLAKEYTITSNANNRLVRVHIYSRHSSGIPFIGLRLVIITSLPGVYDGLESIFKGSPCLANGSLGCPFCPDEVVSSVDDDDLRFIRS